MEGIVTVFETPTDESDVVLALKSSGQELLAVI